jgi:hypothetical protein
MVMRVYFDRGNIEIHWLDAFSGLLFGGNPGEQAVQAPPFINLSDANTLLGWAWITGFVAVAVLARACLAQRERPRTQPQAVAILVSLLTLYCLWHSWPYLSELSKYA